MEEIKQLYYGFMSFTYFLISLRW